MEPFLQTLQPQQRVHLFRSVVKLISSCTVQVLSSTVLQDLATSTVELNVSAIYMNKCTDSVEQIVSEIYWQGKGGY